MAAALPPWDLFESFFHAYFALRQGAILLEGNDSRVFSVCSSSSHVYVCAFSTG